LKLPFIVSLDFGSTSVKCLIFDSAGKKVAQVNKRWQIQNQIGAGLNQSGFDDHKTWAVIASCCQEAISDSHIDPKEIACVITTSQRHGAVLLDEKGEVLFTSTNADEYSAPPWEGIVAENAESIYRITGRWPQKVFFPAHMLWLKKHHNLIFKRISKVLGIQDWLVYRLSGEICSEVTIAADLLLLDINSGVWSEAIARLFQIDPGIFPPLIEAGAQVGVVSKTAANETGLLAGTPVLNGAADSQMAFLGLGALDIHDLVVTFGTSIPLLLLLDRPVFHVKGATWTNKHVFPGQWVLESNSGDSGFCLNEFRNNFLLQPDESATNEKPPSLWELDTLAKDLDKRKTNLIASMGPIIFDGKTWPQVEGALKGVSLIKNSQVGIPHLYFSLIQNIGFAISGNLKQLEQTIGKHANRIYVGGPAIESKIWPQLLADMFDRSLQIPEEKEVTPLGSSVLAAYKLAIYPNILDAVANMVRLREVEPDSESAEFYQQKYQDWHEVYKFSLKEE